MAKAKTETASVEKTKEELAAEKKAAADKAKEDAKAEKAKAKKEADDKKAADKAAKQSEKKNGVTRPNRGVTLKVWEIADAISKETKAPATRKAVTERGVAEGLETGTIHTQYGRWRKFNGLSSVRGESAETK